MAEETTTTETTERAVEETEPTVQETAKPEVPPEVKRALNKANKEAEGLRLKLKEFEDRDKTEAQKLAERVADAEKQAQAATARAVKAEVKALADGFADREDAVLNLGDLSQYVKEGDIDTGAIAEALTKVLERKPHLAAQGGRRFAGSADGGARKATKPDQLTRDDLRGMSPQEIVKAKAEGRLKEVLGEK